MGAAEIVDLLRLEPHPEGGHFREMFRDSREHDSRSVSTAIYFLLKAGEVSRWHRVDAAETWHFYAGASLELSTSEAVGQVERQILGNDLTAGQRPQIVIPADCWQMAQSLGDWTLVGCTVAPGFEFAGFEMAPQGWVP
ncbi:MAG: cupin domain-containing protein [Salaquimonas sp.]|nr:cupin domain-containing protein [Salaquimonas sp.]